MVNKGSCNTVRTGTSLAEAPPIFHVPWLGTPRTITGNGFLVRGDARANRFMSSGVDTITICSRIAWCFAQRGHVEVGVERLNRELAIFEEGEGALKFHAVTPCAFILGAAFKHSNDLVLGTHSVHTSAQSLIAGQRRIPEIGEALRACGKL